MGQTPSHATHTLCHRACRDVAAPLLRRTRAAAVICKMGYIQRRVSAKTSRNAHLSFDALQTLARQTDAIAADCACSAQTLDAWTSMPVSFPEQQLSRLGTLVHDIYTEATFEEFHPQDTGLWSVEVPIAPRYYPCNRCTVWECRTCRRVYLRYVEGGGYFVAPRTRRLRNRALVDAPLSE